MQSKYLYLRFMKLSRYTDYALRALIYLAASDGRLVSIRQIAEAHGGSLKAENMMNATGKITGARFILSLPIETHA